MLSPKSRLVKAHTELLRQCSSEISGKQRGEQPTLLALQKDFNDACDSLSNLAQIRRYQLLIRLGKDTDFMARSKALQESLEAISK